MTTGASGDDDGPDAPIERVRIERRGGLAGLKRSVDCTYAALTGDERDALRGVLALCRQRSPLPASPGADRFGYRLKVAQSGAAERTHDIPEDAMPPALAALVRPRC